ncbi:SMI1/KNR4 family protein [bacterium]|nr:SMI1/KNR4 family protein [bacterium]
MNRLSKHASVTDDVLEPATDESWDRLERMLETKLPASHKRLLKTFGTGVFGGRLLLLNPSAEADWRSKYSARWAHGVASLFGGAFPKYNFRLEDNGLLPFAMTSDSVYVCFDRSEGGDVSSWGLRICSLHDRWKQGANLSSAELLSHLATGEGRFKSALRLKLWCSGETVFKPSPYLMFR